MDNEGRTNPSGRWMRYLSSSRVISDLENETTLSFFNHDDYEKFKANPEEKWM
jgi:hypothetical protein